MTAHAQWQLTGSAAELYEKVVVRYILGPWASVLVDAAHLVTGQRVLDVACGTGVVARVAATRVGGGGHVTGADLNAGMIAVATALPPPLGALVEWLERDACDLQLADAHYDVVLCQQGLQFFPDKSRALREMRRVLVSGGGLAISVWNSVGLYNGAVGKALSQIIGEETAKRFCASRQFPSGEELIRLAQEAGFTAVELHVARLNISLPSPEQFALDHLAATPVAPAIASADERARRRIGAIVREQLATYADNCGVTYPEETHILTARVS